MAEEAETSPWVVEGMAPRTLVEVEGMVPSIPVEVEGAGAVEVEGAGAVEVEVEEERGAGG